MFYFILLQRYFILFYFKCAAGFRSRPPKIQLGGLAERCKLPQRGLWQSLSRQTIWCILTLKSDIWWQQF